MNLFKTTLTIFCTVVLAFGLTFAIGEPGSFFEEEAAPEGIGAEEKDKSGGVCPETKVHGKLLDCLHCHMAPDWKVERVDPLREYDLAGGDPLIREGQVVGYYRIDSPSSDHHGLNTFFEKAKDYPDIKRIIIEIHSPGGSVFNAWRIVNTIEMWKDRFEIETQLRGLAASAGFLMLQAGEKRVVSPYAELMWHEIRSFVMFDSKTPAKLKDEAEEYGHLQRTANLYVLRRAEITEDEINEMINKKNQWLNGRQAYKLGFADELLYQMECEDLVDQFELKTVRVIKE